MQLLKWSETRQLTFIGMRPTEKNHELKSQIRTLWSKETLIILVESTWMQFTISLWPFKVCMQEALEIKTTDILSVHHWFPHRIRKMFLVTYSSLIHSPTHQPYNQSINNITYLHSIHHDGGECFLQTVFHFYFIIFPFFSVRYTINLYAFLRQTNKFQHQASLFNCKFQSFT